jgi:septal ring factor EnvC (AmiA/AmiB activator)
MRAGLKKGAHYSAPMGLLPGRLRIWMALRKNRLLYGAGTLTLLALLGGWDVAVPAAPPDADARKTEAELQAVKSEIERVTRQVSEEQVERDKLSRELRSAEVSLGRLARVWTGFVADVRNVPPNVPRSLRKNVQEKAI